MASEVTNTVMIKKMAFSHDDLYTQKKFYLFHDQRKFLLILCSGHSQGFLCWPFSCPEKKNWLSEIKDLSVFTSNSFLKVLEHFRT